MFVRAVRDAAEATSSDDADGVSLLLVERQIRANFIVECDPSWDFLEILRNASKKALNKNLVMLCRDGKSFRPKERPGGGGGINRYGKGHKGESVTRFSNFTNFIIRNALRSNT